MLLLLFTTTIAGEPMGRAEGVAVVEAGGVALGLIEGTGTAVGEAGASGQGLAWAEAVGLSYGASEAGAGAFRAGAGRGVIRGTGSLALVILGQGVEAMIRDLSEAA